MRRPDFSDHVVHFTSSNAVQGDPELSTLMPVERLESILDMKRIEGSPMPWTGARCASFTECPWGSLIAHAEEYSPYGIGFHKNFLWDQGGGPAIYLRPELYQAQMDHVGRLTGDDAPYGFAWDLWQFITPISRTPFKLSDGRTVGTAIDYSHEREWRVPGGLDFDYSDVAFLIADTFDDVASLPETAIKAIGTDRVLSMRNYRRIAEFWPP